MKHAQALQSLWERAAAMYARANRSDPFAYARMMTHLRIGIEEPGEVIKTYRPRATT